MNHKVSSVQNLFDDAKNLYVKVVSGGANSGDSIINNLQRGINTLKTCWAGKDAGVQIQNLIIVHNAMVTVRNSLGALAETTTKIATNYREIQNSNGAGLEMLTPVINETKPVLANYSDNRDSVNISVSLANNGNMNIKTANSEIENFISEVRKSFDSIMNNWTEGPGRDEFQSEFNSFVSNANRYRELLNQVSISITQAIKNYGG